VFDGGDWFLTSAKMPNQRMKKEKTIGQGLLGRG
jgi:hypothetical protein